MKRREFLSCAIAVSVGATASRVFAGAGAQSSATAHDLLIRNGRVLDGAGNPWFTADVAVKDGLISAIGRLTGHQAGKVIDATGLFVSPGFIDVHSHSDTSMFVDPWVESKIRQGITTDVNGQCGGSAAPVNEKMRARAGSGMPKELMDWSTMGEYFDRVEKRGVAHNIVMFVGHGTVRTFVMGDNHGAPTAAELDKMRALVRQAMEQGAAGLSTGLDYSPGVYAHTDEIVELAKVAAEYGGIYATHYRGFTSKVLGWSGDDANVMPAVAEAIEIGKRAGIRVQISHLAGNSPVSGDLRLQDKVRDLIYQGRKDGVDVYVDILPSDWGSVARWPARSVFAPPYFAEGKEKLLEKLRDPAQRAVLRKDLTTKSLADMGFENYTTRLLYVRAGLGDGIWVFPPMNGHLKHAEDERKTLDAIAKMKGKDLFDALFDLLVEEDGNVYMANKIMDDQVDELTWPFAMPCTDGGRYTEAGGGNRAGPPHGLQRVCRHPGVGARQETGHARGDDPADDVAAGARDAPRRPGRAPGGREGGHHALRPRQGQEPVHLRERFAPRLPGGDTVRRRERRAGNRRQPADKGAAGCRAAT